MKIRKQDNSLVIRLPEKFDIKEGERIRLFQRQT